MRRSFLNASSNDSALGIAQPLHESLLYSKVVVKAFLPGKLNFNSAPSNQFSSAIAATPWIFGNRQRVGPTSVLSFPMVSTSPVLGAAILVGAGIFQWTPLKNACMVHCRSPRAFILTEWREGAWGTLVMGLKSGVYCVACCWLLMVILFVTGVMNLLWMAIITVFVLMEKLIPRGEWFARMAGLLLIGWGMWLAAEALL